MLFNSPVYIFIFLPVVLAVYFSLTKCRHEFIAKIWLVLTSLFFYGYWNPYYLFLIGLSVIVNFIVGKEICASRQEAETFSKRHIRRKTLLILGIVFNLGLLGYFKYTNFFIENINWIIASNIEVANIILPLAISFFTFQQIAFLMDSYNKGVREYDFLNYCLFVTFFPQLIAGPIVHHTEMMPQFMRKKNWLINWDNIALGLFIFSIGLFKKIFIADGFAVWADQGFDSSDPIDFLYAWQASLSYTFQLYYDFSGYTDMAIGAAFMFNIRLPDNFNSPYKARNIADFWNRWHMTLSRWLRDYVYIPLGGNRISSSRTYLNILVTFLIGGLWHGASWTFIAWGAMHGIALVIYRYWQKSGLKIPGFIAWSITFLFINFTWVFFRAESFSEAMRIISSMLNINYTEMLAAISWLLNELVNYSPDTAPYHPIYEMKFMIFLLIFGLIAFFARNSNQIMNDSSGLRLPHAIWVAFTLLLAVLASIQIAPSQFLYFNF